MTLEKLYYHFDQALLFGANKLVRTWNFTTGRTRADLSKLLYGSCNTIAPLTILTMPEAGPIEYTLGLGFGAIAPISYQIVSRLADIREKADIDNSTNDVKSIEAENARKRFGAYGIGTSGLGILSTNHGINVEPNEQHTRIGFGAAIFFAGMSMYVQRADVLPPRKNCVSRFKDWAEDRIRETFAKPEPVPISTRYSVEY